MIYSPYVHTQKNHTFCLIFNCFFPGGHFVREKEVSKKHSLKTITQFTKSLLFYMFTQKSYLLCGIWNATKRPYQSPPTHVGVSLIFLFQIELPSWYFVWDFWHNTSITFARYDWKVLIGLPHSHSIIFKIKNINF